MKSIKISFEKLKEYVEKEEFKGWEGFDGLNSWATQKIPSGRLRFFRLVWIQFFKRILLISGC